MKRIAAVTIFLAASVLVTVWSAHHDVEHTREIWDAVAHTDSNRAQLGDRIIHALSDTLRAIERDNMDDR